MKKISSKLAILGIAAVIGGLPSFVSAEPAPIVNGGARYFNNLEAGNVNRRDYERVFDKDNQIVLTYPSFSIRYSDTQNPDESQVSGVSANGTPQYTYNNQGVVVLPLGERQEAIPYNRQGDASLQLWRLGPTR